MDLVAAIHAHLRLCSINPYFNEKERNSFLSAYECIESTMGKKVNVRTKKTLKEIWKERNKKFKIKTKKKEVLWSEFLETIKDQGFFKGCSEFGEDYRNRLTKAQTRYKNRYPNMSMPQTKSVITLEFETEAENLKKEGNELLKKGNHHLALEKYKEAIKKDFTKSVFFSNRSICFNRLLQHEEAIFDAKEAIRLDPTYIKAYNRLAIYYKEAGLEKEAIEAYNRVIELSPNDKKNIYHCRARNQILKLQDKKKANELDLDSIMKNPVMQKIAEELLSNPESMSKMKKIMKNPNLMSNVLKNNNNFKDILSNLNPTFGKNINNE